MKFIGWAESTDRGSCSYCTRHHDLSEATVETHEVAVFSVASMEVRVCRDCYRLFARVARQALLDGEAAL